MCKIIPVENAADLPSPRYCYVAEPSVENACNQFRQTFGSDPDAAYVWRKSNGRVNVYMAINPDQLNIHQSRGKNGRDRFIE
jgi:hypothetical protein